MPRIPLGDAFGPCALAFDRLPARRSHNLYRRAEPLGQVISDGKCCERKLRAVQADHDPVRMPSLTPLWASEEHRARRIVKERAGGLASHHAEEPTAASTSERNERGVVLIADVSQDAFRITSHDLRRAIRPVAHDLCRCRTSTVSLLFELSCDVAHVEACVYGDAGIERGNGTHSRARKT